MQREHTALLQHCLRQQQTVHWQIGQTCTLLTQGQRRVGVLSGVSIFNEPLEAYFHQKQQQEKEAGVSKLAAAAPAAAPPAAEQPPQPPEVKVKRLWQRQRSSTQEQPKSSLDA